MNHWADYLLFAGFLCASLGIGVYHALSGGKQRTTEEFIMANRQLKVIPTTISLVVSYQSAISMIGGTAEMYVGGIQTWIWSMISFPIALIFVSAVLVPWLYPLKLTSVYKVFEMRYGSTEVRIFSSLLAITAMVLYMGTAMFAPSLALETATGFPAYASIPIMACVCTIYTALGGMEAVIWTDVFQFVIMVAGMLTILIKGCYETGGIASAFQLLGSEGRFTWANLSPDPTERHTIWGFLIGHTIMWIAVYGMTQASVQRFSAIETQRKAQLTLYMNLPPLLLMACFNSLVGVVVMAYFIAQKCDPLASGQIKSSNEFLPLFVKDVFKNVPGFSGLFLATLYSGALSSVSSSLSGAAANTWDDIIKDRIPTLSEYKASLVNKALVISYGAIAIGIAYMVATIPGPILQVSLSIGAAVVGPLIGIFIISGIEGFYWCRGKGVLIAGLIGFAFNVWLCLSASFVKGKYSSLPPLDVSNCTLAFNITQPSTFIPPDGIQRFYSISYLWYATVGALVTIVASIIVCGIMFMCQGEGELDIPDYMFMHCCCKRGKKKSYYVVAQELEQQNGNGSAQKTDITQYITVA